MYTIRKIPFCVFFIFLSFVSIQCKKTAPPPNILPSITREGKNTFGCKVNGEIWIPFFRCKYMGGSCKELGFDVYHNASMTKLPVYFTLGVQKLTYDSSSTSFVIYTDGQQINHTGNVIDSLHILFFTDSMAYVNYFHPDSHSPRYFNIETLDTVNNIVSGSFAFTLYGNRSSDNALDSLTVTEGQFDFQIGEFSKCSN